MKNTALARTLFLALLWMIPAQSTAAVITFDFLALIEENISPINGRLGNGNAYSGVPLSTSHEYFRWDYQGLEVTAAALYRPEDIDGNIIETLPAFVFLQPHFAGLGVCQTSDCAQTSLLSDYDMLFFRFNHVVEITDIRFSRGEDVFEPTSWSLLLLALLLGELVRRLTRRKTWE